MKHEVALAELHRIHEGLENTLQFHRQCLVRAQDDIESFNDKIVNLEKKRVDLVRSINFLERDSLDENR